MNPATAHYLLTREAAALRHAVQKDIDLLDHWADSIGMIRPAQAVRMRMRRDELRKLLNPAAATSPDVPVRVAARP